MAYLYYLTASGGQESRCVFHEWFWFRVAEAAIWVLENLQFSQNWRETGGASSKLTPIVLVRILVFAHVGLKASVLRWLELSSVLG